MYSLPQDHAFGVWLKNMLHRMQSTTSEQELVEAVGGVAKEFGCHSYKKHTETRLTTIPGGPPITSSLIRVGQNLGAVESRYVRDDLYGQNLASRICSLLDPSDSNFDVLPARFNPNVISANTIDYRSFVPGYEDYEKRAPKFLGCLPYLVAAVVHHLPFLEASLPRNHPFFDSIFYTQGYATRGHNLSLLRDEGILLGRGNCEVTGMRSTGVPLYIKQNRKLDDLQTTADEQKEIIDQVETTTRGMDNKLSKLSSDVERLVDVIRYYAPLTTSKPPHLSFLNSSPHRFRKFSAVHFRTSSPLSFLTPLLSYFCCRHPSLQ